MNLIEGLTSGLGGGFWFLLILIGILLDWLIGDPAWLPHPVRLIGWCCRRFEAIARRLPASARLAGGLTVLAAVGLRWREQRLPGGVPAREEER